MTPDLSESTASVDNANVCELRVGGMDCPSCADDISRALHRLEGVEDVRADVVGGSVKVAYAEGKLAPGDLHSAVRRLGYQVHDDEKRRFHVCAAFIAMLLTFSEGCAMREHYVRGTVVTADPTGATVSA